MRAKEIQPNKLVIFDIDDTLVKTDTKVNVIKDGKVIKRLNSHDFTHYKLEPGESFDFGAFRDAKEFFEKAKPILPMIGQLKRDIDTGNKVIMVTAREDFNDRELFLNTFRRFGIDMSKVHVYRAGNIKDKLSTEEKKKIIIRKVLDSNDYTKAIMYDDAIPNLELFLSLKDSHPGVKFYAWYVNPKGEAVEIGRTNESISLEENTDDSNNVADIGINVKTDKKAKRSYADLIVDGKKKFESRRGKSLMPFVGKTVSIIRTGNGPARAIGSVTVGKPIIVNEKQFRELESLHLVPQGSAFDIESDSIKYLYPMLNPYRYEKEYNVSNEGSIYVARKVIAEDMQPNSRREEVEGMTIEMTKQGHQLVINALDDWGNKLLGHVIFNIGDNNELDPQELEVVDQYQGQGIAKVMYDYVKSKGYDIHRSWDQTDAGKGFWDKHRGEDVRVWEDVTESLDKPHTINREKYNESH
jgi:hypothetical protein